MANLMMNREEFASCELAVVFLALVNWKQCASFDACECGGSGMCLELPFWVLDPKEFTDMGCYQKLEFKAVRKFLALSGFGFALLKWRRVAKYWHL